MNKSIWWLILVVALGAAAFFYFRLEGEKSQGPQLPAPAAEPPIRHPIEAAGPADAPGEPLPPLAESDAAIRQMLAELFGAGLEKIFNLKDIIHRIVATVDNLPRDHLSLQLMPVKPVAGRPVTEGKGENLRLSPQNAARYSSYMRLTKAVPSERLVAVYVYFYPLFQEQYEKLGYPGKYFNDRLVEVIDHLLATPEVQKPLVLTQPKVLYEYADPKLERLSAGQKILLRIGSENAAKVKAKLREIRSALVSKPPKG